LREGSGVRFFFKVPDNLTFYSADEIEFFSKYAGQRYRSENIEHESAGRRIKSEIVQKTNAWIRLPYIIGWESRLETGWQVQGYFNKFSWAKLFRSEHGDKKVFFTVGVDGIKKCLVYKLDCQRSSSSPKNSLSKRQIDEFDRLLTGTGAEWREISLAELHNYNWETLKDLTQDFIEKHQYLYQEAIQLIQQNFSQTSSPYLLEEPPPSGIGIKVKPYTFRGVTVDYDDINKNARIIGDRGEELVIEFEQQYLIRNGQHELAKKVLKVEDGNGYDIHSYEINGDDKYIEVKTTTGINKRPFFMTDNEWEFMIRNSEKYYLYRIYDFNIDKNAGKYFKLKGNIHEQVHRVPKVFEIYIK
jgi:hypothetical protein